MVTQQLGEMTARAASGRVGLWCMQVDGAGSLHVTACCLVPVVEPGPLCPKNCLDTGHHGNYPVVCLELNGTVLSFQKTANNLFLR